MYWGKIRKSWNTLRHRSVFAKTWMHYKLNLLRYNLQWYISVLRYGEKSQGARIPFMITVKMRKSLGRLGFQEDDIRTLRPAEAAKIIENSLSKGTWEKDQFKTKKQTEISR